MTLYASQAGPRTSSDLYTIDPLTAVATSVATMSVALTGLAMDPTTSIMYGATSGSSTSPRSLVTVDLVTGATTLIGAFLEGVTATAVTDIAFDASGQLWGWSGNTGKLLAINKATGAFATISAVSHGSVGNGMDFDWENKLYSSNNEDDGPFYLVDATLPTVIPVIPGVELAGGAGPDHLDETYARAAPTRGGTVTTLANFSGSPSSGGGFPINAAAAQGDKFYIVINEFGSPVYLGTVDFYGRITNVGQTLDGIDALATDDPGGRSDWHGASPYPFIESWEGVAINTAKWVLYRQNSSSPISPNQKRSLTRLIPGLDDQDEILDTTLERLSWFTITSAESTLGAHSAVLDYIHPTETLFDKQQLVHWDELGGGANGVEYWMAYQFMIPDWTIVDNSDSAHVELPDFRTDSSHFWNSFTAIGNDLYPDTATTGSFYDWNNDPHPISAGVWHELRIGYMRRSSDLKVVVTQYLDGELIVDHAVSGGIGQSVYGIQWNSQYYYNSGYYPTEPRESLVYIDPIIWGVSDPGPLTNFLRPDFIGPSTVVYQPSLAASSSADMDVPFIAPTGGTFSIYLSGPQDVLAPFIGSTTTVFSPALLGANPARVSQEPVEVLFIPSNEARVSQEPVEVLFLTDSEARISQEPVEVLITVSKETAIVIWMP